MKRAETVIGTRSGWWLNWWECQGAPSLTNPGNCVMTNRAGVVLCSFEHSIIRTGKTQPTAGFGCAWDFCEERKQKAEPDRSEGSLRLAWVAGMLNDIGWRGRCVGSVQPQYHQPTPKRVRPGRNERDLCGNRQRTVATEVSVVLEWDRPREYLPCQWGDQCRSNYQKHRRPGRRQLSRRRGQQPRQRDQCQRHAHCSVPALDRDAAIEPRGERLEQCKPDG